MSNMFITINFNNLLLDGATQINIILCYYNIIIILCYVMLYYIILYCVILHRIASHGIILYHIILSS